MNDSIKDGNTVCVPSEMFKVKRAIFMAAGFGSRLAPVTISTPKPLVRVHGKRIIDGLIDACLAAGISEIYVVRGYLAEQFDQLLQKYPMIQFIENSLYDKTNNISSVLCAKNLLSCAYVFESDLMISNPEIITPYQSSSNFLAIRKSHTDDWCFDVENNVIVSEKVGGDNCWQMVGISCWSDEDGKKLAHDIEEVYGTEYGKQLYWEQVPLVYKKDRYRVQVRECNSSDIVEIDTFEELMAIDPTYKI